MEKDLVDGQLGAEGKYDVDFVDGKIKVEVSYMGAQGEAGLFIKLDLITLLEVAAKKTSNKIDDAAVAIIKGLLK